MKQSKININITKSFVVPSIVFFNEIKDILCYFKNGSLSNKIFLISDSNVSELYLKKVKSLFIKNGFTFFSYVFKAGEKQKNLKVLSDIYDYALKCGVDRKYNVIALGGGVVGDMSGLFASTYMRGLNFIQIPTTLLAMVDSAIGGKTAVNTENGKNVIGTFYQPKFTFVYSGFLETLSLEQLKNGMAEVIKYAISFDKNFFNQLLYVVENSILTQSDFKEIIYKCCEFKANIVEQDEKEIKGVRQFLNFGHTFAHALETITKYKKFLHGEAVAIGMLFATKLSHKIGLCDKIVETEVKEILTSYGFVLKPKLKCNSNDLLNLMKKDKKSISQKIKFVLPTKIGEVISNIEVKDKQILQVIEEFLNE